MGTPGLGYQFKIGDTVAYRKDTWRKGTIIAITPKKAHILWKIKTTLVDIQKLVLIDSRTNEQTRTP